jgi:peptidoglycan/LPS O-acetylase OafA/YrhL
MNSSHKVYFPNLDGLRTLAFLAVFLAHSFWTEFEYIKSDPLYKLIHQYAHLGVLGVNFFFILSGFLITYLLLQECSLNNRIDIKAFYIRRVLRIWPLYFVVVFIGFIVVPFVQSLLGQPTPEQASILHYLLFLSNFDQNPTSAVLGVLWSIAVEEQFYILWPIVFIVVKKDCYKFIFPFFIILSLLIKVVLGNPFITTNPFVCMSDMAVGGWAAYLAFNNHKVIEIVRSLNRYTIITFYLLGSLSIVFIRDLRSISSLLNIFDRLILSIFFVFILIEQSFSVNSLFKASKLKFISKLGAYTYSLYMLHFVCIYIINKALDKLQLNKSIFEVIFAQTLFSLTLSLLVAFISYNYYEKYFLSLKNRFSYVSKDIYRPQRGFCLRK